MKTIPAFFHDQRRVRRPARRGMSLLFVVSLILFITLLGTSFVVVSRQFAQSAKNRTRIDARGDDTSTLVDRAFYDLVRGPQPDNVKSVLRTHSLLADLYGFGISAEISATVAAVNYTAPQDPGPPAEYDIPGAIEFTIDPATLTNLRPYTPGETPPATPALSDTPGAYNGLLLTFVEGPLTGTSVRIVGYSGIQNGYYTGQPYTFTVYREQSRDVPGTFTDANGNLVADIRQTRVVINGRACFGWGAGGPGAGGGLGSAALSPNRSVATSQTLNNYVSTGVNESYDAPDYQNLWMSAVDQGGGVIAAFDRQSLYTSQGSNPAGAQNFRAFGNPTNPLQVDNDGDGVNDSIWIDAGFPVQTDIDGRRFKALVAYLVLDMDGRFNVNAHGDLFDFDPDGDGFVNRAVVNSGTNLLGGVDPVFPAVTTPLAYPFALPHGQYLGPPEVSMAPLFGSGNNDYRNLVFSRYGEDMLPGNGRIRDAWPKYIHFGHPDLFRPDESYPNQWVGGLFGTAQDLHGRYGRGIPDQYAPGTGLPAGQPASDAATGLIPQDEIRNSSYEFNLLPQSRYAALAAETSDDQPFTAQEVERILRQFDRDSQMLPSRLAQLYGNRNRHLIGHASFETPAIPGLEPIPALNETPGFPVSLTQRVYNLLVAQGVPPVNTGPILEELLSYELRMGLPFDLNRPFGDGRDNDGDGIYDEPDELVRFPQVVTTPDGGTRDMAVNEFSRYIFAKQLFVLALLATGDTDVITPVTNVPNGGLTDADTIRRMTLAQWVINIVDFRDADSICTPFEFDFNPFNGWSADGNLATADGGETTVVWGCERPELLLSESVAFHDRRIEDLESAGGGQMPPDDDFDSRLVPNASVFFELYRPWTQDANDQLRPAELGADNTSNVVDLTQVSAPGNPVWRLVVTSEANLTSRWKDVGSNQGNTDAIDESEQYRRIYFTEPDLQIEPDGPASFRHKVYWPGQDVASLLTGKRAQIGPGEFAVVGSAGKNNGSAYETWFGRRTESDWDNRLPQTRGITLLPDQRQVEIRAGSPNATATTYEAVAIPVNATVDRQSSRPMTRSVAISDPVNGYYDYLTLSDVTAIEDGFEYISTKDIPVDMDPSVQPDPTVTAAVMTNEVTVNFRSVLLQRLADPTQRYDPVLNPYLTIDGQFIDLTPFNGAAEDSMQVPGTSESFASNERGRVNNPDLSAVASSDPARRRRLWPIETTEEILPQTPIAGDTHFFTQAFYGSLGTFNRAWDHPDFQLPGAPPVGFAGLSWNNRPFANHLELMIVPFTNSAELLASPDGTSGIAPTLSSPGGYTLDRLASGGNPYQPGSTYPVRGSHFGHLLNFFAEVDASTPPTEPRFLINLLDFVRVPSRFAGTQIHLNGSQTLFPPFNALSRYREPGKINVNTAAGDAVLNGWLGTIGQAFSVNGTDGNFQNIGVQYSAIRDSRQAQPFRNAAAFAKTPPGGAANDPVAASWLRTGAANDPLFNTFGNLPWADPARDSSYRYETFRRIGATTTTRSSVFAIWVTVGFFEVNEDGTLEYYLSQGIETGVELGADRGKARRGRGFYLIDRSIPVGFEPGANHNVEQIILSRTIME
jgi:hypothetical protein